MRNPIDPQDAQPVIATSPSNQSNSFNYVDLDKIEETLICPICQLPFVDPIVHSCENTFCSNCIESLTTCPFCRQEGDLKQECVVAHKIIRNQLEKLKVYCGMCKNVVNRGDLKDHQEKYCPLLGAYVEMEKKKQELDLCFQSKVEELKKQHEAVVEGEKKKMEQERIHMLKELEEVNQQNIKAIRLQREELEKERKLFLEEKASRYKLEFSNKPVHLNVGGTVMTVSLSYFMDCPREPNNLFKKMFNGEHPLYETPCSQFGDKVYFLDCNPDVFKIILNWMRYGMAIFENVQEDIKAELLCACNTFKLDGLIEIVKPTCVSGIPISHNQLMEIVEKKITLFEGIDFRKVRLMNVDLSGSEMVDCNLSGMTIDAKLKQSKFTRCDLSNSKLVDSKNNLTQSSFIYCKMRGMDLSGQDFSQVEFIKVDFTGSNFSNSTMGKVSDSILTDCSLIGTSLMPLFSLLNKQQDTMLQSEPELSGKTATLLFRASRDGFTGKAFHSKCNGKQPTITLIKSEHGYIFGGYTQAPWNKKTDYVNDSNAFIFTFKNGNILEVFKQKQTSHSIYNRPDYLATFGGGHDIHLCDNCNSSNSSYSNFGHTFNTPGAQYGTEQAKSYLAGSYNFKVLEIETYQLV